MGKFNWDRPQLRTGQLEAEDRRFAARGIKGPEQVRADLIRAAGHLDGASRAARLRALARKLHISEAYPDNVLAGRQPIGPELLDRLYGPSGCSMPMAWTGPVDDWGPMLPEAAAAGLAEAGSSPIEDNPPETNSSAPGLSPVAAPAALASVAAPTPVAATETETAQAPAKTTSPAPELGPAVAEPAAVSNPGTPDAGEGSAPVGVHAVTAGEGSRSDGASPPPSPGFPVLAALPADPLEAALDALAQLAQREAAEAKGIEADIAVMRGTIAVLQTRLVQTAERRDRARRAYEQLDELRQAGQPAQPAQVAA